MPTLKNVCPMGDIELHDVGLIEAGAEFEVSEARAERLLKQRGNYELVSKSSATPAAKKKG